MKFRMREVTRAGGVLILFGSVFLLFGGLGGRHPVEAEVACPPLSDVSSVTQQSDVPALDIVVKRPRRPPGVDAEQAAITACGEGGYLDASSVSAEHGQFIGSQFGIPEPGRPMWILTFHDICEPFHGPPNFEPPRPCAATEGFVLVDSTMGEFVASLSGPIDL